LKYNNASTGYGYSGLNEHEGCYKMVALVDTLTHKYTCIYTWLPM